MKRCIFYPVSTGILLASQSLSDVGEGEGVGGKKRLLVEGRSSLTSGLLGEWVLLSNSREWFMRQGVSQQREEI